MCPTLWAQSRTSFLGLLKTKRFSKEKHKGERGEWIRGDHGGLLTFTLQALPQEAPEQGATMVAEGGDLVVVDAKLVWHVDTKPLGAHLQGGQNRMLAPGLSTHRKHMSV